MGDCLRRAARAATVARDAAVSRRPSGFVGGPTHHRRCCRHRRYWRGPSSAKSSMGTHVAQAAHTSANAGPPGRP